LLNNTLNEALRIHRGPLWQIFQVHVFLLNLEFSPLSLPYSCGS
jgi:hypothetical protein